MAGAVRKQQTFDDLYAIAEELFATGVTTSGQLAVEGHSNGGLLTGAAVVQRPDLWAAVVSKAPILDLIGLARDPLSHAIARAEYGDPNVAEEAEWLTRVSPRQNVKPGTPYCATLFIAGSADPRCPPWHVRTLVALLREATTSDDPILLRVHTDQGHASSGLQSTIDQTAEWLAFVAARTGLQVGQ